MSANDETALDQRGDDRDAFSGGEQTLRDTLIGHVHDLVQDGGCFIDMFDLIGIGWA
jgi:hypothetical protein